jgi:hypothetical protein
MFAMILSARLISRVSFFISLLETSVRGSCSSAHVVVETPHWVDEVGPAGSDAAVEVVVVVAAAG